MSLLMKAVKINRVRAQTGFLAGSYRTVRGDPGFLDGLWNGIKGAATGFLTGGIGGAIVGGAGGILGAAKSGPPGNVGGVIGTVLKKMQTLPSAGPGGAPVLSPVVNTLPAAPPPLMLAPGAGNNTQSGGGVAVDRDPWTPGSGATPCGRGYHYNKSGYYSQRYGWIPKGTVCVKNRKRNPLNPRATSRAMARLVSAKKAVRAINKFFGGGSTRRAHAPAGKKGCGCRK